MDHPDQSRRANPADASNQPAEEWPLVGPGAPITDPCIAVPVDFQGTEAEAVGLAVAGAVGELQRQRDAAQASANELAGALHGLIKAYPRTSFAGSEVALERAQTILARYDETIGQAPDPKS